MSVWKAFKLIASDRSALEPNNILSEGSQKAQIAENGG